MVEEAQDDFRPLKATLKAGPGYEAPWLTVAAFDVNELTSQLDAVLADEGVLQKVADVAALFRAAHVATAPAPQENAQNNATASSADAGATVTQMKTCQHGVREYKSGTKNGRKWEAWFCPEKNKSAQCAPIWGD